jgi:hypothetical protein
MARSQSRQGFSSFTGSAGAERRKRKGHHLVREIDRLFFEKEAKKQKTSYQRMMRQVIDWYASQYQKSA